MQGTSFLPLLERKQVEWRDAFYYEFHEYPDYDHCARKHRRFGRHFGLSIEYRRHIESAPIENLSTPKM